MIECGWAASRTKNTYLRGKYNSLVGRLGRKRTLVAVGRKILIISYYILKYKVAYRELGMDYLDNRKKDKIVKSCIKRLKDIGYEVVAVKKVA